MVWSNCERKDLGTAGFLTTCNAFGLVIAHLLCVIKSRPLRFYRFTSFKTVLLNLIYARPAESYSRKKDKLFPDRRSSFLLLISPALLLPTCGSRIAVFYYSASSANLGQKARLFVYNATPQRSVVFFTRSKGKFLEGRRGNFSVSSR